MSQNEGESALTCCGRVVRVSGPVVVIGEQRGLRLGAVVRVGPLRLLGEVIRLRGDEAVVQMYEDTTGLHIGDEAKTSFAALEVELGPGLLGSIYDGLGRPLSRLAGVTAEGVSAPWLVRGASAPTLDRDRLFAFVPSVEKGDTVAPGDVLGTVREGPIVHRVLVPGDRGGVVTEIAQRELAVTGTVAAIDDRAVSLLRRWPVRRARPFARRLDPTVPLLTGQRVIDSLFPIARGGSATIPGGFGTGKTVTEQSLAKWADADIIVYIACGERGNELSELLTEFPALTDPRTGAKLMERTVLIANTSNMPVAAREASIYTGLSIAEYYRDQGYAVAVLADSTSRWAEALREVSGRLEEMPGEEGYPAYLPSRLAELYERAGRVVALGSDGREGSVTVIAAVSPPGGDFSEPVTQYSLRLAGAFWALDPSLARRRHFPAIDVIRSYSLYDLAGWFRDNVSPGWDKERVWALSLVQKEQELLATVQLLGPDMLSPADRLLLAIGRILRENFLQQSAFDERDASSLPLKQYWMLWAIRELSSAGEEALAQGVEIERIELRLGAAEIRRMRYGPAEQAETLGRALVAAYREEVRSP